MAEQLYKEIYDMHWKYLLTEDNLQKLKEKNNLIEYVRNYLCITTPDKKFFLPEIIEVLKESIREMEDFSPFKLLAGFEAISQYANNLITHSWRKEYQTIRMYCGYYQHEVKSNLIGADKLFEAMGYIKSADKKDIMCLDGPICPDRVANVSRDSVFAYVECLIISEIYFGLLDLKIKSTWDDIFQFRQCHGGNIENAIKTIIQFRSKSFRHSDQKSMIGSENLCLLLSQQQQQQQPPPPPPSQPPMQSNCNNCMQQQPPLNQQLINNNYFNAQPSLNNNGGYSLRQPSNIHMQLTCPHSQPQPQPQSHQLCPHSMVGGQCRQCLLDTQNQCLPASQNYNNNNYHQAQAVLAMPGSGGPPPPPQNIPLQYHQQQQQHNMMPHSKSFEHYDQNLWNTVGIQPVGNNIPTSAVAAAGVSSASIRNMHHLHQHRHSVDQSFDCVDGYQNCNNSMNCNGNQNNMYNVSRNRYPLPQNLSNQFNAGISPLPTPCNGFVYGTPTNVNLQQPQQQPPIPASVAGQFYHNQLQQQQHCHALMTMDGDPNIINNSCSHNCDHQQSHYNIPLINGSQIKQNNNNSCGGGGGIVDAYSKMFGLPGNINDMSGQGMRSSLHNHNDQQQQQQHVQSQSQHLIDIYDKSNGIQKNHHIYENNYTTTPPPGTMVNDKLVDGSGGHYSSKNNDTNPVSIVTLEEIEKQQQQQQQQLKNYQRQQRELQHQQLMQQQLYDYNEMIQSKYIESGDSRTSRASDFDSYEDTQELGKRNKILGAPASPTTTNKNNDGVGSFDTWNIVYKKLGNQGYSKDLEKYDNLTVEGLDLDTHHQNTNSTVVEKRRILNTNNVLHSNNENIINNTVKKDQLKPHVPTLNTKQVPPIDSSIINGQTSNIILNKNQPVQQQQQQTPGPSPSSTTTTSKIPSNEMNGKINKSYDNFKENISNTNNSIAKIEQNNSNINKVQNQLHTKNNSSPTAADLSQKLSAQSQNQSSSQSRNNNNDSSRISSLLNGGAKLLKSNLKNSNIQRRLPIDKSKLRTNNNNNNNTSSAVTTTDTTTTTGSAIASNEDGTKGSETNTVKEWNCEFCTFINPISIRICEMCSKTRDSGDLNATTNGIVAAPMVKTHSKTSQWYNKSNSEFIHKNKKRIKLKRNKKKKKK